MTNETGKSDRPTVPKKVLNKAGQPWHRSLSQRSQNGRVLWDRMRRLITRWLPLPSNCHPYPLRRMGVVT
jgi:hypothetical protein